MYTVRSKRNLVALLLTSVAMLLSCQQEQQGSPLFIPFEREGSLTFADTTGNPLRTIDIEIADNPHERQQGLMNRRSLELDQGMLFIFPESSTSPFWMKNTYIPLDIIFVGPDSQVVDIAERTRIMSEESIKPDTTMRFVVEVPAGFTDRFNITEGARVRWTRRQPEGRSLLSHITDALNSIF